MAGGLMQQELVDITTAAAVLDVDPSTIRRYGRQGKLLIIGSGRGRRVNVESLQAYARGEAIECQNEIKVRRVGVVVSATKDQSTPRVSVGASKSSLTANPYANVRPVARKPKPSGKS